MGKKGKFSIENVNKKEEKLHIRHVPVFQLNIYQSGIGKFADHTSKIYNACFGFESFTNFLRIKYNKCM